MGDRYRLITIDTGLADACAECGAVVYDTKAHDRWHDNLDTILSALRYPLVVVYPRSTDE